MEQVGVNATSAQMAALPVSRHPFHGDWSYTLHPASRHPATTAAHRGLGTSPDTANRHSPS